MWLKKLLSLFFTIYIFFSSFTITLSASYVVSFDFDEDYEARYSQLYSPLRMDDNVLTNRWDILINSKFNQPRPVNGTTPHRGIDLPGQGHDIYPIAPGIIRFIHFNDTEASSKANLCRIIIELDLDDDGIYDDIYYVITHLKSIALNQDKTPAIWEGMEVATNTFIGTSGQYYGAYHLHWGLTSNTNSTSDPGYSSLIWRPAQKYYREISEWEYGHDCDFISDLSFDRLTNKISVYCYINTDGGIRESPKEVALFYRIHGTSAWQPYIAQPEL